MRWLTATTAVAALLSLVTLLLIAEMRRTVDAVAEAEASDAALLAAQVQSIGAQQKLLAAQIATLSGDQQALAARLKAIAGAPALAPDRLAGAVAELGAQVSAMASDIAATRAIVAPLAASASGGVSIVATKPGSTLPPPDAIVSSRDYSDFLKRWLRSYGLESAADAHGSGAKGDRLPGTP